MSFLARYSQGKFTWVFVKQQTTRNKTTKLGPTEFSMSSLLLCFSIEKTLQDFYSVDIQNRKHEKLVKHCYVINVEWNGRVSVLLGVDFGIG